MKRYMLAALLLSLAILVTGCSNLNLPFLEKEEPASEGSVELEYKVEQLVLSKGYQNTDPKVDLVQKNNEIRLLVYPGLLKSTGVEIKNIVKDGSKITVHIINKDNPNSELVIPQISILLTNIGPQDLKDAAFSIVNENYTPIKISYGIVDVINKLKADMKISTSTNPEIRLYEEGERLLWEIVYENIFDKDSKEIPLINLKVIVDAATGDLVMSSKSLISSLIDEGKVLSLDQEHGMLYVNDLPGDKGSFASCLWIYSIDSKSKAFLYGTNHSIESAGFSPNAKHIYFLENDGTHKMLYVLQLKDLKAVKVALPGDFLPARAQWKDSDELYITEAPKPGNTRVLLYNTDDNSVEYEFDFDMEIINFTVSSKNIAIAQIDGEKKNRRIFLSVDNDSFDIIGNGWQLVPVDNGRIAYLEHNQKSDTNSVVVYDPTDDDDSYVINRNFSAIYPSHNGTLMLVEKINGGSEYSISLLDTGSRKETYIGKATSDKVFLHHESGLLFVDLVIPFQSEVSEIIYTVSVDELK